MPFVSPEMSRQLGEEAQIIYIRRHFPSFMEKKDVRDRHGRDALGTTREP